LTETLASIDDHGRVTRMSALVSAVDAGSPAEAAGLSPGDRVLAVDGHPLRDLIDWRWHAAEESVEIEVVSAGAPRTVVLRRGIRGFGVSFDGLVFDGVRTCENACEFCFVSQLPEGLRPSLYLRDDDYRLSFLAGNFITLTNLTEEDVERIRGMRLSPLYVSLHAVDPAVRKRLIRPRGDDHAVAVLSSLFDAGIDIHAQIVLVPGVNDGAVLDETLDWLEAHDGVRSVGVVPLGFTAHQSRYGSSFGEIESRRVVMVVEDRRARRAAEGRTLLFHAADELYLTVGLDLPAFETYGGFPQYENGIGLVRSFLHDWPRAMSVADRSGGGSIGQRFTLVTGTLFAPVLERLVSASPFLAGRVEVLRVHNDFFGGGVTVTGLLTGRDLMATIRDDVGAGPYLVPDIVLNAGEVTLDDFTSEEVRKGADADVRFIPAGARELAETLMTSGQEK